MKELKTLLRRLEAHLQDEIAAQERTLALLADEQTALCGRDPALVLERTTALERELQGGVARARRRDEILTALGSLWGVPAATLTLTSIAERAGPEGERVLRMRGELRERSAKSVKLARRVGALARTHQRFFSDVLQALFGELGATDARVGGRLVDAEA
ncbi:MAG: flagellar export chaperone FlgN [Planctomycetes bacterium]|nr:flagellar export chaperone FlgN [Planctomycetota bacterium]